jgi:hypothetical protein
LSAEGRNAARASRRGRARLFRSPLLTILLLVAIGATACSQETRDKLREAVASGTPSVSVSLSLSPIPTRSERPSRSPRPSQEPTQEPTLEPTQEPTTTASSTGRPSATASARPTAEPSEKPTQEPSKKPKPSEATSPAAGAQPGGNGGASPAESTPPVGSPTPIDVEASSHEETSSAGPLFFLLLLAALALVVGALMRRGRRIDERRRLAADALLACVRARDALATLVGVHERSPDRVAIAVQRIADSRTAVSSLGAASDQTARASYERTLLALTSAEEALAAPVPAGAEERDRPLDVAIDELDRTIAALRPPVDVATAARSRPG